MSLPGLLHNMSVPPSAVIVHRAPSQPGRALLFRLPPGMPKPSPRAILACLDGRRWRRGEQEAAAELRRRLDEHAARLPFPPAALTTTSPEDGPCVDDLLTVCTVLAKSSDRLYLRDKEPNLTRITPGRTVVLRIPDSKELKA